MTTSSQSNHPRAAVVEAAKERAAAVVSANASSVGLRAGGGAYPEVWARDAIIAGLGLAASGNSGERELLVRSLQSLAARQSDLGRIPNHVRAAGEYDAAPLIADTMFAGAVDPSLWFIIGNYVISRTPRSSGDGELSWGHVERAYHWLEYQDSNECGLLEVHESMDWADLFANRYNSLLPNVLWYAANRAMVHLCRHHGGDGSQYADRADDIRFKINQLLWVGPEVGRDLPWIRQNRSEWIYPVSLADTVLGARPYFLPYMAFRDYGDRFDTLGNLLAILFGLADRAQTDRILDYVDSVGLDQPWPVKACWPVVTPGDSDWREYYRLYNLNQPHQYHNGGAWPFLGGFYVAALVQAGRLEKARNVLTDLAEMNRIGYSAEWEFNEWFHGQSGRPMGHKLQTWSAGMFLYAYDTVVRDSCAFFEGEGW
ncbi:MAG: amylo-alpha-1,6-glucosidase [Pseudonocardiaceae bacterium]